MGDPRVGGRQCPRVPRKNPNRLTFAQRGIVRRRTLPGYLRLQGAACHRLLNAAAPARYLNTHYDNPRHGGLCLSGADMADLPRKQTQEIGKGKPGPGRPKGSPTRRQPHSKEAILQAAAEHGEDDTGKDGLKGYLRKVAREDVKAFSGPFWRVLPLDVNAAGRSMSSSLAMTLPSEALKPFTLTESRKRFIGLCDGGEVLSSSTVGRDPARRS